MLKTIEILGYPVVNETPAAAARQVADALSAALPQQIAFLNPHSVAVARHDAEFHAALSASELIFCDGAGLALACRILNRTSVQRIYGYEFFRALSHELSARQTGRVMFLGGSDAVMQSLQERYQREFPGIRAVTCHCPPYRPVFAPADVAALADSVKAFAPDVLWIGLGSPKQEKVMHALRAIAPVPCTAAIGAVFDFYTGRVSHAPAWMRATGLQWLHRLVLEPRRLWRRTFISGPQFALEVLRNLVARPAQSSADH